MAARMALVLLCVVRRKPFEPKPFEPKPFEPKAVRAEGVRAEEAVVSDLRYDGVMVCRWALVAALVLGSNVAHAEGTRVLVRVDPQIARSDADRLVSAMRAQLLGTASIELESGAVPPACVVEVDRTRSGLVLRFTDGMGRHAGAPRTIVRGGEIGASEAAAIVRAFVAAAMEQGSEAEKGDAENSMAADANRLPSETPDPPPAPSFAPAAPTLAPDFKDRPPPLAEHRLAPSRSRYAWRARIAALYTGATYASELPWQSGARIEGAYSFIPGWYGGVTYAFYPTADMVTESASVRLARSSGAAVVGVESTGPVWAFGADAAAGIERAVRESAALRSGGGARIVPLFAMRLHGRWRIPHGGAAAIDVAPTIELALGQEALALESNGMATRSLPAVARFRMDVGATFDFF
ncbi:hypothetical protein [Pendulispora albinea]|uniref:Uncharacterized protein n=1 Tax=Pendulispora albinea TaxID=2741071 RepID=A0ABZ2M7J1_9BACT